MESGYGPYGGSNEKGPGNPEVSANSNLKSRSASPFLSGKVIMVLMKDERKRANDTREECELKFDQKE